jgi:hypothetical protein
MCLVSALNFSIDEERKRWMKKCVQMNELFCPFIMLDNGSPRGSSMFFGHIAWAPALKVGPQNICCLSRLLFMLGHCTHSLNYKEQPFSHWQNFAKMQYQKSKIQK